MSSYLSYCMVVVGFFHFLFVGFAFFQFFDVIQGILTRENHLRRDTYTVFALDDFEFDAPFGVPSLDCDRIATGPMLDDPNDEWFANFSNWIPLPKWIPPYCDDIDRMDAPNTDLMTQKSNKNLSNEWTKKKTIKEKGNRIEWFLF